LTAVLADQIVQLVRGEGKKRSSISNGRHVGLDLCDLLIEAGNTGA
jgi:hypothetical protein